MAEKERDIMRKLVIYGTGGAGRELANSLSNSEEWSIAGFVDDFEEPGKVINGFPVLGDSSWLMENGGEVAVCIVGDPLRKKEIVDRLKESDKVKFPVIRSPGNMISDYIEWGEGCILSLPKNYITVNIKFGDFVFINCGNLIGHDVEVGDFTTIYSGINIGGGVKIGSYCVIGTGVILNPGVRIGDNVVVGAGAVVTKDIPDSVVVAGVPAKVIKEK